MSSLYIGAAVTIIDAVACVVTATTLVTAVIEVAVL